ncbi:MAG: cellulase family glycosylhydrolase [Candidatus Hydrogenedens sp.]
MKKGQKRQNNNLFFFKNIPIFFVLFTCVISLQGRGDESFVLYQTGDLVPFWTVTRGYMPINNSDELQLDPRGTHIAYAFPTFNQPIDIMLWEVTFQIKNKYNDDFCAGLGLAEMKMNNPRTSFEVGILKGNEIRVNPLNFSPKMSFTVPENEDIKISVQKENNSYDIRVNNKKFSIIPSIHLSSHLYPVIYIQSCSAVFKNFKLSLVKHEQKQKNTVYEPNLVRTTTQKIKEGTPKSLSRIRLGERKGKKVFFKTDNEEVFVPRGFNHVVLEHGNSGWHALFNTNVYQPDKMDLVLKQISECGGNVIRVWAWGTQNEYGFISNREEKLINEEYMNNFIDFLRKATLYNIYVIPILDEYPNFGNFETILMEFHAQSERDDLHVTGYNRQFFWNSFIKAKAIAIKQFIEYIKDTDASLLSTVLAWSLQNEIYLMNSEGPFSTFTAEVLLFDSSKGKVSTEEERQKIYDRVIIYWANELTKAVKSVDPTALVTAGMWTSDSAGRKPSCGLLFDNKDARFPPRPAIVGGEASSLDFIDIHIYPWDNTSKVNPECHEHGLVKKPVIVGEYGVFQNVSVEQAKTMLIEFLQQAYQMGYIGDLYWVWDLTAIPEQTYSAVIEGFAQHVLQWDQWKQYFR